MEPTPHPLAGDAGFSLLVAAQGAAQSSGGDAAGLREKRRREDGEESSPSRRTRRSGADAGLDGVSVASEVSSEHTWKGSGSARSTAAPSAGGAARDPRQRAWEELLHAQQWLRNAIVFIENVRGVRPEMSGPIYSAEKAFKEDLPAFVDLRDRAVDRERKRAALTRCSRRLAAGTFVEYAG